MKAVFFIFASMVLISTSYSQDTVYTTENDIYVGKIIAMDSTVIGMCTLSPYNCLTPNLIIHMNSILKISNSKNSNRQIANGKPEADSLYLAAQALKVKNASSKVNVSSELSNRISLLELKDQAPIFINPDGEYVSVHVYPYITGGKNSSKILGISSSSNYDTKFGVNAVIKIPLGDLTLSPFYESIVYQYTIDNNNRFENSYYRAGVGFSIYFHK